MGCSPAAEEPTGQQAPTSWVLHSPRALEDAAEPSALGQHLRAQPRQPFPKVSLVEMWKNDA